MTETYVSIWEKAIGKAAWSKNKGWITFIPTYEFNEIYTLVLPIIKSYYGNPFASQQSNLVLQGLFSDSLPDKFGNRVMNQWLISQGIKPKEINPVERLKLIGKRGMGAFEFELSELIPNVPLQEIKIDHLVQIVNKTLNQQSEKIEQKDLEILFLIGTSAGGARAKAILLWNPKTSRFYTDKNPNLPDLDHWLIKFDGIHNNRDKEQADPQAYGKIEYAYYLMALEVGIKMTPCRLYYEGCRSHFMTKRFDRTDDGGKLHMQTLGGLAGFDYNQPDKYSYEQAIQVMQQLDLLKEDFEQQVLRTMFNIVARNQDDHVKNIPFLMNPEGEWRLSPAYDVTYAYDPNGLWTGKHQMSVNGKRDGFTKEDLITFAIYSGIKSERAYEMLDNIIKSVKQWEKIACETGIDETRIHQIRKTHRLSLLD